MKQNILLFLDTDRDETLSMKLACANYSFVSYSSGSNEGNGGGGPVVVTDTASFTTDCKINLSTKLKQLFREMEVQSK